MEDKIKLIWDFRGPTAKETAIHHEIHLKEYAVLEKLEFQITGVVHTESLSYAYLVVSKNQMKEVRDVLKPHRGQLYLDQ